MRTQQIPQDFRAEWIWKAGADERPETYLFFRKEVVLDAAPPSAEIWISARSLFHLYVNGRHVAFGPPAYPRDEAAYVCRHDVGHLLEPGVNVIAVLAHNTRCTRFAGKRRPGGLLVQLQCGDAPVCWTNSTWQMMPGDCYAGSRPRRSVAAGFAEKLDGHKVPHGWQDRGFNANHWRLADWHQAPRNPAKELVPVGGDELILAETAPVALAARGTFGRALEETHVAFDTILEGRGAGVYAAETFFHSDEEGELAFSLYADNPYRCIFNIGVIKEQGVQALPAGVDLDLAATLCCRQGETVAPEGSLPVRKGWNRLVLCQLASPGSPGFTFLFPDLQAGEMQFLRQPDDNALPGWNLAGPLRAPLASITPALNIDDLAVTPFHATRTPPVDEAVHLLAYAFTSDADENPALPDELILNEGGYAVFDWGRAGFGVPALTLEGPEMAEVDLVFGERLEDGRVELYPEGRQNVDTVILGANGRLDWQGCAPRGFRYLMAAVRKAASAVRLRDVVVTARRRSPPAGVVDCSDPLLNSIWQTGHRTLDVTMQDVFMDSPCKETAQYIPDAMIQSMASCSVFGDFAAGTRAIREFALAQTETGEMPAVCPSDNYVNIPDYALLWPVWVQRQYMYTGDLEEIKRLFPSLDRLLTWFDYAADPETGLLQNLDRQFGAPCFLDHGRIDRGGMVTGLNAVYCRALQSAAWLAEQVGDGERAADWRERAAEVVEGVRAAAFDADAGLFADSCHGGVRSEAESWQTNVLALYGGLAKGPEYQKIFDKLFQKEAPYVRFAADGMENPYFKFFVLEVAVALNRRAWALDMIRHYWGGMLEDGAANWWEFFSPEDGGQPRQGSLCHGYGVYPNSFLALDVAGIRPARPGFSAVFFNPLLHGVEWVKAEIPTKHGVISVNWRRKEDGSLHAVVNSAYPVDLIPRFDASVAATATVSVGDEVSVLVPEDADAAGDTPEA